MEKKSEFKTELKLIKKTIKNVTVLRNRFVKKRVYMGQMDSGAIQTQLSALYYRIEMLDSK